MGSEGMSPYRPTGESGCLAYCGNGWHQSDCPNASAVSRAGELTGSEPPALAGSGELTEPFAPRTYASAWQFHDEIDACDPPPVLLTAEDWLGEEADVYAELSPDEEVESDPRAQIMRAIAAEIRALRVERQQFADALTAARTELEGLRARIANQAETIAAAMSWISEQPNPPTFGELSDRAARSSGAQTEETR